MNAGHPLYPPECEDTRMDDEPSTKRCTRCDTVKPREEFGARRNRPGGLVSACRACTAAKKASYRATNRDKLRDQRAAYRTANPDKVKARDAAKYATHRDEYAARGAAYHAANLDQTKARQAAYRAAIREKLRAWDAAYPLLESLAARVAALEALLRTTPNGTVNRIAPERPRRKRAVHEHPSQAPAVPSATPPVIRTIKDIVDNERVTAAEAKRIQEREILARAEWRPAGNA